MPRLSSKGWPALVALSALAGNRSMSAPAAFSRFVTARHAGQTLPAPASYLNDPLIADGLALLAAGELIADKLPFTPNRTDLLPLLGRGVFGGMVGAGVSAIQGKDRVRRRCCQYHCLLPPAPYVGPEGASARLHRCPGRGYFRHRHGDLAAAPLGHSRQQLNTFEGADQVFHTHRLAHVVVHAGRQTFFGCVVERMGGHGNDPGLFSLRELGA